MNFPPTDGDSPPNPSPPPSHHWSIIFGLRPFVSSPSVRRFIFVSQKELGELIYVYIKSNIVYKPSHLQTQLRIHNDNIKFTIYDFKMIAKELWKKYIIVGCAYEINIDGYNRRKYKRLFENDDNWITNKSYNDYTNLSNIFNPCIEQLTSLITASFVTWRQSNEYNIRCRHTIIA